MSQLIAFIRHGDYHQQAQTPSAWQPYPLNDDGRQQAQQCAHAIHAFLQSETWTLSPTVHCSVLLRAYQTAELMTHAWPDALPFHISSSPLLNERCVGSFANLSISAIEEICSNDPRYGALPENWKSRSDFCLPAPGAESLIQAGQRVAHYIQQLVDNAADNSMHLIVGHGAALRHAAYHFGVLAMEDLARLSMHHAQAVYLQYSQEQWSHYAGDWKIRQQQAAID